MVTETADRPLTTAQVAALCGVNPSTVRNWTKAGRLPCFRLPGGHRRFLRADVEALLADGTPTEATA